MEKKNDDNMKKFTKQEEMGKRKKPMIIKDDTDNGIENKMKNLVHKHTRKQIEELQLQYPNTHNIKDYICWNTVLCPDGVYRSDLSIIESILPYIINDERKIKLDDILGDSNLEKNGFSD